MRYWAKPWAPQPASTGWAFQLARLWPPRKLLNEAQQNELNPTHLSYSPTACRFPAPRRRRLTTLPPRAALLPPQSPHPRRSPDARPASIRRLAGRRHFLLGPCRSSTATSSPLLSQRRLVLRALRYCRLLIYTVIYKMCKLLVIWSYALVVA